MNMIDFIELTKARVYGQQLGHGWGIYICICGHCHEMLQILQVVGTRGYTCRYCMQDNDILFGGKPGELSEGPFLSPVGWRNIGVYNNS